MISRETKIAADYAAMMQLLHEVLERAGEHELAGSVRPDAALARVPSPHVDPVSPEQALQLVSMGFQLLNMVEENTAVQLRRQLEKAGRPPQRGTFDQVLKAASEAGVALDGLSQAASDVEVELVLTAHPTEARRRTVIAHYRELYVQAVALENSVYTPRERDRIRDEAAAILERLWRTSEVHLEKPSVEAERAYVVHHAMNVFPDALHLVADRYHRATADAGFGPTLVRPKLRFGSWVGGEIGRAHV